MARSTWTLGTKWKSGIQVAYVTARGARRDLCVPAATVIGVGAVLLQLDAAHVGLDLTVVEAVGAFA